MASSERKHWVKAVEDEKNSLNKSKTWHLVQAPDNVTRIELKWIFKIKRDENGKIIKYKT